MTFDKTGLMSNIVLHLEDNRAGVRHEGLQ